mmetsp:Transcript_27024/g.35063  ORF Transcript_27024/g.35063 Transcript_27024/m.35063 type:complete len:95 (-) Transcript_27024:2-286(-)
MYTSGSTGKPKGVMLRHSHVVASLGSMIHYISTFCEKTRLSNDGKLLQESYLAYLPAAHIFEFAVSFTLPTTRKLYIYIFYIDIKVCFSFHTVS